MDLAVRQKRGNGVIASNECRRRLCKGKSIIRVATITTVLKRLDCRDRDAPEAKRFQPPTAVIIVVEPAMGNKYRIVKRRGRKS